MEKEKGEEFLENGFQMSQQQSSNGSDCNNNCDFFKQQSTSRVDDDLDCFLAVQNTSSTDEIDYENENKETEVLSIDRVLHDNVTHRLPITANRVEFSFDDETYEEFAEISNNALSLALEVLGRSNQTSPNPVRNTSSEVIVNKIIDDLFANISETATENDLILDDIDLMLHNVSLDHCLVLNLSLDDCLVPSNSSDNQTSLDGVGKNNVSIRSGIEADVDMNISTTENQFVDTLKIKYDMKNGCISDSIMERKKEQRKKKNKPKDPKLKGKAKSKKVLKINEVTHSPMNLSENHAKETLAGELSEEILLEPNYLTRYQCRVISDH